MRPHQKGKRNAFKNLAQPDDVGRQGDFPVISFGLLQRPKTVYDPAQPS